MHSVLPVLQFFAKSRLSHHSWQEPTIAHCWRCLMHKTSQIGAWISSQWLSHFNVQVIWPHIEAIRYTFLSCPQNTFGTISDVRFSKITKYVQPFFSICFPFFCWCSHLTHSVHVPPAPWWLITSHRCGESLRQLEALRKMLLGSKVVGKPRFRGHTEDYLIYVRILYYIYIYIYRIFVDWILSAKHEFTEFTEWKDACCIPVNISFTMKRFFIQTKSLQHCRRCDQLWQVKSRGSKVALYGEWSSYLQ